MNARTKSKLKMQNCMAASTDKKLQPCANFSPLEHASGECITLLLRLAFDRCELECLLKKMCGSHCPDALQVGALYGRLLEQAQSRHESAALLYSALEERLHATSASIGQCPMFQMACMWSRVREKTDVISAASILWLVARESEPMWRQLEAVIISDLKYLATRGHCESLPKQTSSLGGPLS